MKHLFISTLVLLTSTVASAKSLDNLLSRLEKAENAQVVVVDNPAGTIAQQLDDPGDMDDADLLKKLSVIKVITIEKATALQVQEANNIIENEDIDGFEPMITTTDDGENVAVYTAGDDTTIKKMLVMDVSSKEISIVLIEGDFNRDDAGRLIQFEK